MGKIQKKYVKGAAATYISRTQALKKLQLSLKDFRRLCILKGIFPHEPRHKKKLNKGGLQNKTWYYVKDINFLAHEPIINKFREYKIYLRKLKKAVTKKEPDTAERLRENQPKYTVDHIVRERYPTFTDSLRDLDDALCMIFLFARMPHSRTIPATLTQLCRRLSSEFLLYIIESRSLRKVFVSVKGIYYQTDVMGNTVTWIVPHDRCLQMMTDVDFQIMSTFVEFYVTMLGFVNFKLYNQRGMIYPPKLQIEKSDEDPLYADDPDASSERIYALSQTLEKVVDMTMIDEAVPDEFPEENVDDEQMAKRRKEQEQLQRLLKLFEGQKVFLSREVPRESLAFVIRCFGGQVSWDKTAGYGSTFPEMDEIITHQIVDRPNIERQQLGRHYVQPQWVYDSVNARLLLPVEDYFPGAVLPPHLSPFVEESPLDYIPPEKLKLLQLQGEDVSLLQLPEEEMKPSITAVPSSVDADKQSKKRKKKADTEETATSAVEEVPAKKPMQVKEGKIDRINIHKRVADQAEERKLQEMLIAKKHRRAYQKMKFGEKRKAKEVRKLQEKRKILEESTKSA